MEDHPVALPERATLLALPAVSKQGFSIGTMSSVVFAIINGKMPRTMIEFFTDYSVVHARNAACSEAMRLGAEWLWFVDSDMDFPIDTLPRLQALDADIACVDMWSRSVPSFRTVMRYGKPERKGLKSLERFVAVEDSVADAKLPADVDCCGMACTLIRTSLIRKFAKAKMLPFTMSLHGEDAAFCILARKKFKATIRCDFGITAGHWGASRHAGQPWSRDPKNVFGQVADKEMLTRMGVQFPSSDVKDHNAPEPERK